MILELNAKIPRGIVLTTKAYDSHLEGDPNLRKVIDSLQEVSNQLCSEIIDTEKRLLMQEKLENQCEELETKYNDSCQQNQIQTLEALTLKKQITEHMDTAALLKAEIIELRAQVVQLNKKNKKK